MKKYLIILAAAAALTGCAKNEVIAPELNGSAEITFTTAPITKALAAGQSTFDTGNVFQTYAWYSASSYAYTDGANEEFVPESVVSYNKTEKNWKTATSYFWPKDGGVLSFFSWSLNKGSLEFASASSAAAVTPKLSFTETEGVTLTGYSCLQNDDFMVADPALNQTGNVETYEHVGVPTLFRHKTAKIQFKVQTKKSYTGRTFTLDDISFVNVPTSGDYKQGTSGVNSETWSTVASTATTSHYSGAAVTTPLTFSDSPVDVPSNGTALLIPQGFSDGDGKKLSVTYTITNDGATSGKQKTAEISMFALLGGSATVTAPELQKGKIYTFTLIFSGSEITWDPKVVDWLDENKDISVSDQ